MANYTCDYQSRLVSVPLTSIAEEEEVALLSRMNFGTKSEAEQRAPVLRSQLGLDSHGKVDKKSQARRFTTGQL